MREDFLCQLPQLVRTILKKDESSKLHQFVVRADKLHIQEPRSPGLASAIDIAETAQNNIAPPRRRVPEVERDSQEAQIFIGSTRDSGPGPGDVKRHVLLKYRERGGSGDGNRSVPFGLKNAAQAFQHQMDSVCKGLNYVFMYLDDILGASCADKEHGSHLAALFDRLKAHGLVLNLAKCVFAQLELKFWGHRVASDSIRPAED